MRIPLYWAEAKAGQPKAEGRVKVSRFGWSDESPKAAKTHAQARAEDALARIVAGEELTLRERKVPYNGADGLPIREEILAVHGEAVVTRNSYGARCLNTETALFADVDFESPGLLSRWVLVEAIGLVWLVAWLTGWPWWGLCLTTIPALIAAVYLHLLVAGYCEKWRGGAEGVAERRVTSWSRTHPEWSLRIYRTPAGLRLLVTHRSFDCLADKELLSEFFRAIRADYNYANMCRLQRCFRARLTPKPWRIGISESLKPRPGVWPVDQLRLPDRIAWVQRYERESKGYAACTYMRTLGSAQIDAVLAPIVELHDRESGALQGRPIA